MDEQMIEQAVTSSLPKMTVYEQLYQKLHAYNFGTISFLELLDAFEEILHLKTHSDQSDAT
jgi:hypothetical protein